MVYTRIQPQSSGSGGVHVECGRHVNWSLSLSHQKHNNYVHHTLSLVSCISFLPIQCSTASAGTDISTLSVTLILSISINKNTNFSPYFNCVCVFETKEQLIFCFTSCCQNTTVRSRQGEYVSANSQGRIL